MSGQLVGRYRIAREVGRGGGGAVFQALDPAGRPVALKLLLGGQLAGERERERFGREVQSLLRVRHPQVVALLDAGQHQGAPYLVEEWVEGETLAARLERDGRLDPRDAAELVRRLALGLEHCHARGVLHRDLKPHNVLLRAGSGEPLLTDFGVAKDLTAGSASEALTREGAAVGTPGWWPPEQVRHEQARIGPWSDVYGLGALLFFCVTGERPHRGETLAELMVALTRPPAPPSARTPGVPQALDEACLRCLALEPGQRFASAGEVAAALEGWLMRASTRTRQAAPRASAPPAKGAGPSLAPALALLALGLSVAAAVVFARRGPDPAGQPAEPAVASSAPAAPGRPTSRTDALWLAASPELKAAFQSASDLHSRGDLTGALLAYDRALALDPGQVYVLYNRGVVRQVAGDAQGALSDYRRAVELDPDYVPAVLNRGLCLQGAGRIDEALADFERVIELAPGLANGWNNRGMVRYLRGQHREALADWDEALALDGNDPRHWANRGSLKAALGDLPGCLTDYDRALALAPQDAGLFTNRGVMRSNAGDVAGALQDYQRAIELEPGYAQAWYNLAQAREKLGDPQGALADYAQAIALGLPGAYTARGALLQGAGDYAAALEDYRRVLELQPDDEIALYNRGLCKVALGRPGEAIADFERAAQLAPGAAWAPNALAEAARLRGLAGR